MARAGGLPLFSLERCQFFGAIMRTMCLAGLKKISDLSCDPPVVLSTPIMSTSCHRQQECQAGQPTSEQEGERGKEGESEKLR